MANLNFHPEDTYREKIVQAFQEVAFRYSSDHGVSRSALEMEIRNNPGKYPDLSALNEKVLRSMITRVLTHDPRSLPNPAWKHVWIFTGAKA